MNESLSVTAVLSRFGDWLYDLFSPVIELLGNVPWALGDWTLFTPFAVPFLYWLFLKVARRRTHDRPYGKLMLLGLLLGGVIEFFQPAAERMLLGPSL